MDSQAQGSSCCKEDKKATETQVGGSHYKDMAIQPIEYCQKNHLSYCESNAIKYISRHRKKNGKEDVLKAIHMLQLLLELEYPDLSLGDIRREGHQKRMDKLVRAAVVAMETKGDQVPYGQGGD